MAEQNGPVGQSANGGSRTFQLRAELVASSIVLMPDMFDSCRSISA
jgi:hypothetical protein